jgi:hypothetical protein
MAAAGWQRGCSFMCAGQASSTGAAGQGDAKRQAVAQANAQRGLRILGHRVRRRCWRARGAPRARGQADPAPHPRRAGRNRLALNARCCRCVPPLVSVHPSVCRFRPSCSMRCGCAWLTPRSSRFEKGALSARLRVHERDDDRQKAGRCTCNHPAGAPGRPTPDGPDARQADRLHAAAEASQSASSSREGAPSPGAGARREGSARRGVLSAAGSPEAWSAGVVHAAREKRAAERAAAAAAAAAVRKAQVHGRARCLT